MNANVLSILGVSAKEDVISNLLRYCIEASPAIRDAFLAKVFNVPSLALTRVRALTRVSTDSSGIPDVVVAAESAQEKYLVVLENKLKADEGDDQTIRYCSRDCMESVKRRVGWSSVPVTESFIFLTLFPDQRPAAGAFRSVSYQDVLNVMRVIPRPIDDPMAQLLLDSWMALLEQFYSKSLARENDLLLARLQEADPLEGNYLYFKSFVDGLSMPDGLSVEETFRSSAKGRRYFGAVISKPSWHPAELEQVHGRWPLDVARHFNIHFEPQFHYLKGILELYLHYEVNPYQPVKWVRAHVDPSEYAAYEKMREGFVHALGNRGISGLKIGGRTNQIAKAQLKLENATVRAARELISDFLRTAATHIDAIQNGVTI